MKILVALNVVGLIAFLVIVYLQLPMSEIGYRMRYTELDRAGVINEEALAQFHPSFGFSKNPRKNVPDYIVGTVVENAKSVARYAAAFAGMNVFFISCYVIAQRVKRRSKVSETPPNPSESRPSE